MLFQRILRQKTQHNEPKRSRFLGIVIVAIAVLFVVLSTRQWLDNEERQLLPTVPQLTRLETFDKLTHLVPLPTQTFGAQLFEAGLYHTQRNNFTAGTISVVYVKDGWRFVQIDYLPELTAETYLANRLYPTQEMVLNPEQTLWIQTLDERPRCIDYKDTYPNRCEISHQLIINVADRLVLISADGNRPTQGELIAIAKSMLEQKTDH